MSSISVSSVEELDSPFPRRFSQPPELLVDSPVAHTQLWRSYSEPALWRASWPVEDRWPPPALKHFHIERLRFAADERPGDITWPVSRMEHYGGPKTTSSEPNLSALCVWESDNSTETEPNLSALSLRQSDKSVETKPVDGE
ncbi:uncharacterized protein LOC144094340 [Amblyomma americanum]